MITPDALKQHIDLISMIRRDYPSKRGGTDWAKAFAEHPDWAKLLGQDGSEQSRKVLSNFTQNHKEAIKKAKPGPPATAVPVTPAATPEARVPIDEARKLVAYIGETYQTATGKIDWKAAFEAEPELREKLQWDDPQSVARARYYASKLGISGGRKRKVGRPPGRKTAPISNGHSHAIECAFCPKCGTNIMAVIMALRMADKIAIKAT